MGIREIIKKRFNSSGFTMIEMIAAMVLVSILVPGISIIIRGSLLNVAFTNMAVLANMEADFAQRKFVKHINGVKSFSAGELSENSLKFTSYFNNAVYEYNIDQATQTIKCSKDGGADGILLQRVVKDTTIDADQYISKFKYKDKNNNDLGNSPTASEVHGVELTFYLLRGESFYKYTTYATTDKEQIDL
jgi:prepilin-type N-terminal cleavage/methylation domain